MDVQMSSERLEQTHVQQRAERGTEWLDESSFHSFREGINSPSLRSPSVGAWKSTPSLRILSIKVDLAIPRTAAAPRRPPTTQFVSRSTSKMWSRSASMKKAMLALGECLKRYLRSAIAGRSTRPVDIITVRSMKFCSSRILPGQSHLLKRSLNS